MSTPLNFEPFFDPRTQTLTWLVFDASTRDAVVIDPVLDFEPPARVWTEGLELIAARIDQLGLKLHLVLETHLHADHLSGAQWLNERYRAPVCISKHVTGVQAHFAKARGWAVVADGSQFDRLLEDDEVVKAGALEFRAIPTPGHTTTCLCFLFGDALFTGDALLLDDNGVGRCDFPLGSALALYDSVQTRLFSLPPSTRLFPGHDYPSDGRPWKSEGSIASSRASNVQLKAATTREEFVERRTARDRTLSKPRLISPSIETNLLAGRTTLWRKGS